MSDQKEVPVPARMCIEVYRGYRIYEMRDGYEAYKSSHPVIVGTMVSKKTNKVVDEYKNTRIHRLVLPAKSLEEAKQMIRNRDKKKRKKKQQPNTEPTLF